MGHLYPLSDQQPFDWDVGQGVALDALSPAAYAVLAIEPPITQPKSLRWWAAMTGYESKTSIQRAFSELHQYGLVQPIPYGKRQKYIVRTAA